MGVVVLGGNFSSGVIYSWMSDNLDVMIINLGVVLVDVSVLGMYMIEVINVEGCVVIDQVVVSSDFDVFVVDISISEVSCFQVVDGVIIINIVVGGMFFYSYSLNGSILIINIFFGNFDGSMYNLLIIDVNGCFIELEIELIEFIEVVVSLIISLENEGNEINFGDLIMLQVFYDLNILIDIIIWQLDIVVVGLQDVVIVSLIEMIIYSVIIMDINGCLDLDNLMVIVCC